jgi:hypothetical protein
MIIPIAVLEPHNRRDARPNFQIDQLNFLASLPSVENPVLRYGRISLPILARKLSQPRAQRPRLHQQVATDAVPEDGLLMPPPLKRYAQDLLIM